MKEDLSLVEQTQKGILKYISQRGKNEKLPKEQEFVELLGVSRVVVREALSYLRAVGIIETKRKQGTVVKVPAVFGVLRSIIESNLLDKNTLRDLYQLRLMIEIGMADFVFQNRTEKQMAELDEIVASEVSLQKEMAMAGSDEEKLSIAGKLTEIDILFHSKLYDMTGNKSLMDFQYILRHLFTLYYPKIKNDWHTRVLVSHVSLFNILRTGTIDAFRMGMRLHLKTQFDTMEEIVNHTFRKSEEKA